MKTAIKSIEAWIKENNKEAYKLYLLDEGCLNLSFDSFCAIMPNIIKRHNEMLESQEAHSKLVYD